MSIVAYGSASVSLSCYPSTPAPGDSLTVTGYFSCACTNDGDTTETIDWNWRIEGDASNYGSGSTTLGPGQSYDVGSQEARGTFSAPYSANASVYVTWNGSTVQSATGSLQVG
jgi:hypothetical protein